MTELQLLATDDIPARVLRCIRALLDDAFDGAFSDDDWAHALGGWHVLVTLDGALVAHASAVPRAMDIGERSLRSGYVEAMATTPNVQGAGHGAHAMYTLMQVLRREFDIGLLSTSRHGFYERLGWERWQGPTFVFRDGRRVRTEDEDDGIMALRFGVSADVSLADPIACLSRTGDDW